MCKGSKQQEYDKLTEHIIHYANARFKQLTLFLAITAGLTSIVFVNNENPATGLDLIFKGFGAFTTIVFFIIELSSNRFWIRFVKKAAIIEEQLKYDIWTKEPPKGDGISATLIIKIFYFIIFALWITSFIVQICCEYCQK